MKRVSPIEITQKQQVSGGVITGNARFMVETPSVRPKHAGIKWFPEKMKEGVCK